MNKKQAYEEKLSAQLDEWNAKIDVLKAKASKAESSAKVDYYETIEDLQQKSNAAKEKLKKLQSASDDAWEDLKEGIENAWSDFRAAIKSATSRFEK